MLAKNKTSTVRKPIDKPINGLEIDMLEGLRRSGSLVEKITTRQTSTDNWAIILDTYALRPIKDRVLVQQDGYKSARDCTKCKGIGHLNVKCSECKGRGTFRGKKDTDDKCTTCFILRDKSQPASIGAWINLNGHEPCDLCNGLGSSSIVVPDDSKIKTSTGNVIAIGRQVTEYKVGTKVMFTNYTGTPFEFVGLDFRLIHEMDILCEVRPIKQGGSLTTGTYAELDNTGVAHD